MTSTPSTIELQRKIEKLEAELRESRQSETELRKREAWFKSIIDTTETVIYVKDPEGRYLQVNKQYEQHCSVIRDDIIGCTDHDFFPRELADIFRKNDLEVIRTAQCIRFEELFPHRDGERHYISTKFPLYDQDGNLAAVCGISTDITDRKHKEESLRRESKALEERDRSRSADLAFANKRLLREIREREVVEKALRESEAKFRKIFENLKDVYFETSLDGTILISSPSGAEFSGYSMDELIGNNVSILYNDINDRDGMLKELKEKGKTREFEILFKRKDGTTYDISMNADFTFDSNGVPTGLSGTIRDITLQKQLKERIQRAQKMESIGLMAGGIAHDLNNILSGLVGYPDLLLRRLPEDSPHRRPVEVIRKSGQMASAVVSDLLTVAKGIATDLEIIDLNRAIKDYLDSGEHGKLRSEYPAVFFKTDLDPNLLCIKGSLAHIKKALMNLFSNASEAIEYNGQITIRTENCFLEKSLRGQDNIRTGEYVHLSVQDTGAGISEEDISRIFEPFYTKKMMGRKGTGLGLTVVWNVVRDHNGHIETSSDEYGTTFDLYFPVTRERKPDRDRGLEPEDYMGRDEMVLVVDDEEGQREIACAILESIGYRAASVSGGEKALEYLKNNKADLLVLDMLMPPGMNGLETYKKVLEIHPGQKAIIASGFTESEDVKAAQSLGAGEFVKKPYTIEKIGQAIRAELDK